MKKSFAPRLSTMIAAIGVALALSASGQAQDLKVWVADKPDYRDVAAMSAQRER